MSNLNKVAKEYIQTALSKTDCTKAEFCADGNRFEYNKPATNHKFAMGYQIGEFYMDVFTDDVMIARIIDGRIYLYEVSGDGDSADLSVSSLAWFKLLEGRLFKN